MPDAALYRQIVDVLLAEHEASTPPRPSDEAMAAKLGVTWGLYCQVHRFARAAMLLADTGMGHESVVLNRVMLEHTIVLHWIIARGADAIDAMFANQSRQTRKWLDRNRGTALEVPQDIVAEITDNFEGIDETNAVSIFSDICRQVGCMDLYGVHGFWSQTVHPSVATSNAYIAPSSGALQITPRLDHPANVTLVAYCLIWAQRAFDRLLPDPARAQGLENLAGAIQAIPVLPDYQPPTPPKTDASGGRRSRRKRAGGPAAETEGQPSRTSPAPLTAADLLGGTYLA
jgi:hypothetical protein